MKYFKTIFFILFLSNTLFLFSAEVSDEFSNDDWILAVSEFEGENLDQDHKLYKKIVSHLFLIYLSGGGKRLVPFEEKKLRAIMAIADKKLSLIKELTKLIKEKDDIFLSIDNKKNKTKKTKKIEKKIKQIEDEIYYAGIDIRIDENKFFTVDSPKNVKLWKDGNELYKFSVDKKILASLKKDKIDGLISGSIKNVSGYMIINVKLDTGIQGLPVYEFHDAGAYENVEDLVQSLSLQIYSVIQNAKKVKIFFDVSPKEAKLYIDNKRIDDFSKPITLYEGSYQISASAENYLDSSKKVELKDKKAYKLKIDLQKDDTVKIGFDFKEKNPYIFFKSQYKSNLPGIITVPKTRSILEFENSSKNKTVHSFALFEGNKIGSHKYIHNMIVELNKKNVKASIELQRKIMYWSLGAFYISLPFAMITKAQFQDKASSFRAGTLANTPENSNKINSYKKFYLACQGIAITLGVNYLVQLIIYLVKADRALPRPLKIDTDTPIYKKLPIQTVAPKDNLKNKNKEQNKTGNGGGENND